MSDLDRPGTPARKPDPETPEQWREAVDAAHALLLLHSARLYGLVTGGPHVDARRCEEILRDGRSRGFHPRDDAFDRLVAECNGMPGD